ncbi:cAMP-dependent protein kinase regulatory subunit-like [Sipha flava]|uniref:cAMP-dependent protein kinase regulatory subunit-like n=1 Tax=Sipha flava TaxID=143950 RepID=A0A8B8GS40_9HEMI|nr:cAMP-dependent protein kinase regulatory subunit-like [Sipha flava]
MSYIEQNDMDYNDVSLEHKTTPEDIAAETDDECTSSSFDGGDVQDHLFRHHVDDDDELRLDRLRTTLIDFTVNCLLEQPCDLIDYGIEFFDELKSAQCTVGLMDYGTCDADDKVADDGEADHGVSEHGASDDDDDDDDGDPMSVCRRPAVLGELLDPDVPGCYDRAAGLAVKSDSQRRMLLANVSEVFVFGALDVDVMNLVIDAMQERCVRNGDVIIRQGNGCNRFYVVEAGVFGESAADADSSGGQRRSRTYSPGDSFGELALLYDEPCDATVVALSNGLLWTLDRNSFRLVSSLVSSEYRCALGARNRLNLSLPVLRAIN